MLQLEIKDINNVSKGILNLSDEVFGCQASDSVVHAAVVAYLANQRQGTHAVKSRGMVSGSGKKPWKQKHTGRARHGSMRSPVWPGGGTVFGPQPRDYSLKLTKSMKKTALFKALTMKLADGELLAIDSLQLKEPKTKEIIRLIDNLGLSKKTVLIVLPERNDAVVLASRNIPLVDTILVSDLNAYKIAEFDNVLFLSEAIQKLQGNGEVAEQ